MKLKKLIALALTLCICASMMVPMASAAKYQGNTVKLGVTTIAEQQADLNNWDVSYAATMTMESSDAKAFAVYLADKDLQQLTLLKFVCVLKDSIIENTSFEAEELAGFNVRDSKDIFEQLEGVTKKDGALTMSFRLSDSAIARWVDEGVETIGNDLDGLTVTFAQSSPKRVSADLISSDFSTQAYVDIYEGSTVIYEGTLANTDQRAAFGEAKITLKPYTAPSEGGDGGGSSSQPEATVTVTETNTETGEKQQVNPAAGSAKAPIEVTVTTPSGRPATPGMTTQLNVRARQGYAVSAVYAVDRQGNRVALTDLGNGSYQFVMPAGGARVEVEYESVPYLPGDTGVSSLLNTDEHIVYTRGNDEGLWRPTASITRGEIATMLYRLLRNKNVATTVAFSDVEPGIWYEDAAKALASLGIMVGNEGKFRPDDVITRAEFIMICVRFAESSVPVTSREFPDVGTSFWAHDAIGKAVALGWVIGYPNGTFGPNNDLTRSEAVTIINRVLGRPGDIAAMNAGRGASFPDVARTYWAAAAIAESATAHSFSMDNASYTETWK